MICGPSGRWAELTTAGSTHHFSFTEYYDPARTSWGSLRVWNDDTIQPKTVFPLYPHPDMEIIAYGRKGAISRPANQGNESRTEAGDVQVTALEDSEIVLVDVA